MQTEYTNRYKTGYSGQDSHTGPKLIDTKRALENMDFGAINELGNSSGTTVKLPRANQFILSGNLSGDHVIGGTITVISKDGTAVTNTLNRAYASSHSATMTNLQSDIDAFAGISSVALSNSNLTVTITPDDDKIVILDIQPDGTTPPSVIYNFTGEFYSINRQVQIQQDSNGEAQYKLGDSVSIKTQGSTEITCEQDFNVKSTVYVRVVAEANKPCGSLRTSAGSPVVAVAWTSARFKNKGVAGELATIEINKP